jgi:lipopolysaccharide transport system ATP-binding protein
MGDVSEEGRTVMFVSHNMGAIQKLCTRSLLLEQGQMILDDDTQQVVATYLSAREEENPQLSVLHSLPRRSGLGELVRITRCLVLNSRYELADQIKFGEPFAIYIEAAANEELRDLSVIIGIDSFTEYRITTLASEDSGVFFCASPTHPLHVRARLDNLILKPGTYLLTLGIRSRGTGLDHLPHVMRLEISEVSETASAPDSRTWGIVHTLAIWKNVDRNECNT